MKRAEWVRKKLKYFICGFSGCGKTTKLNSLKEYEDYKDYIFVDLDDYIFEKFDKSHDSLGELISDKGFEWFRQAEKAALLKLLEENKNIWIALGGGTLDEDIVTFLTLRSDVEGYWINESFEVCWERIRQDPNRPMVGLGEDKLREIYQDRQKIFKKFKTLDL